MDDDKFDIIYKLLTEHNFDMNENVPDKLKCVKCRKILINACQARCGCRFCRSCVDEMMMNGCQVCPGITDDCKIALLSNALLDYRANNKISNLILKCPEEMCSEEYELINMEEHLRMCGKKSVKCPFYNMGCDEKKITSEMMNFHFQLENYNHSKILIEMIDNIKNEIFGLREKENRNGMEIEKMKDNLKLKDERIKSINAEMELMKKEKMILENRVKTLEEIADDKIGKMEKKELEQQMEISLKNIWNKIDEVDLEMNKRCENDKIESINEEIKLNKLEKEELEKKMEMSFGDLNRKVDEINVEMRQARQTMKQEMMEMRIEPRINQLEKFVDCRRDGIFEMAIYNVDEWRNNPEWIWSEYFYVRMQSYKLQLCMCPYYDDDLWIWFYICDDVMNEKRKWPFKADVTTKVINKNKPDACKSITQKYEISGISFINLIMNERKYKCNENFIYSFSDLTKNGFLESNYFILQFSVVF